MDRRIFFLNEAVDFEPFCRHLSADRLERIGRAAGSEAKGRVAAAELLLIHSLKKSGIDEKIPLRLAREENGKPYLLSGSCNYSISHSGGACVCVVSKCGAVGIDIQETGGFNLEGVARRVFSAEQMTEFAAAVDKDGYFFDMWTAKESYVKFLGSGVALMKETSLTLKDGKRYASAAGFAGAYVFSVRHENFFIAVSTPEPTEFRIEHVAAEELLRE